MAFESTIHSKHKSPDTYRDSIKALCSLGNFTGLLLRPPLPSASRGKPKGEKPPRSLPKNKVKQPPEVEGIAAAEMASQERRVLTDRYSTQKTLADFVEA